MTALPQENAGLDLQVKCATLQNVCVCVFLNFYLPIPPPPSLKVRQVLIHHLFGDCCSFTKESAPHFHELLIYDLIMAALVRLPRPIKHVTKETGMFREGDTKSGPPVHKFVDL